MTRLQKAFCWLALFAGLAILALGIRSAHRRYQMVEHWPSVAAQVTRGRVVYASEQRKPRYFAEYHFRYRVKQIPYTASITMVSTDYREAQDLVARHPAGSTQALHYNPQNPAEIAMNPAYTPIFFKLPLILAGVSLAFIFVGGLPLWIHGRRPRVEQVTCPNCQRSMDRGRRHCPFCKEELVKY